LIEEIGKEERRALKHAETLFVMAREAPTFQTFPTRLVRGGPTTGSVCVLLQQLPASVSSIRIVARSGGPVKSLLDPSFKYVPSVETDIRKTFARIRREARREVSTVAPPRDRDGKIALLFGDKKRAL